MNCPFAGREANENGAHSSEPASPLLKSANRAAITLVGQILWSSSNYLLAYLVLRFLGPEAFGSYSVALGFYLLSIAAINGLVGDTLLVKHSGGLSAETRERFGDAVSIGTVGGALVGAGMVATGLVIGGPLGSAILLLGLFMPLLICQEVLRLCFLAAQAPIETVRLDAIWLGAEVIGLLLAFALRRNLTSFLFVWGVAVGISTLSGLRRLDIRPRLSRWSAWFTQHRKLSSIYFVEGLLHTGTAALPVFIVGAISGLEELALMTGATTVLGPLTVLNVAANRFALPETAALVKTSPDRVVAACRLTAFALVGIALASTTIVLLPTSLTTFVFGDTAPEIMDLIPAVAVMSAANGAIHAARIALRAFGGVRSSLLSQIGTTVLAVIGAYVGARIGGVRGAAVAISTLRWLAAIQWWLAVRLSRKQFVGLVPGEPQ